jgi:2-haloacid dehalogenase
VSAAAHRAYAFDLFGTLVDYSTLREPVARLVPNPAAFVDAWRRKQLQYALWATIAHVYVDFDEITVRALDYTAALDGIVLSDRERAELAAGWAALPAFADVAPALDRLREGGARLAILSNGAPQTLARAVQSAGIAGRFDAVLSAHAVRAYKPSAAVYRLAADWSGLSAVDTCFVSSNGWDATGAAEYGLDVTWCNRDGLPDETLGARVARRIETLAELL